MQLCSEALEEPELGSIPHRQPLRIDPDREPQPEGGSVSPEFVKAGLQAPTAFGAAHA